MNKRRQLILALGTSAVTAPFGSFAQQQGKVWRIGILGASSSVGWAPMINPLRTGLRELGYVEGRDIVIESRWAEGRYERLPGLAHELARLNVDVIVTHATVGARAAKDATDKIPIVIASIGDPVVSGLVKDLARPGGNITGLAFFVNEIAAKRLELLKELIPNLSQAVVLTQPYIQGMDKELFSAARNLKVVLQRVDVQAAANLQSALATIARERAGPIVVWETPMLIANGKAIGEMTLKQRTPAIGFKEVAEGGGLLAYGASLPDMWRRSAVYVDKILRGAKPGDIPVEQATKFEMIVNLKTAKEFRLTVPQSILLRADKVIE